MKRMYSAEGGVQNCNFVDGDIVYFLIKEGDSAVHQVTLEVYDVNNHTPRETLKYRLYLNDGWVTVDVGVWPVVTKEYGDLHYIITSKNGQVSTSPQTVLVG